MKIGIIREGKVPPDSRVTLSPKQCKELMNRYSDIEIKIQSSPARCFSDSEYDEEGIAIAESLDDCEVLLGVKEVPLEQLVTDKTYFFFSHTIKEQPYNRGLLQEVVRKNIRLIDYECLTNDQGIRVIAFGRWAGIVGAYNGLYTWGKKTGYFELKRVGDFKDYEALKDSFADLSIQPLRIVVTGDGRVAEGSSELLDAVGIKKVSVDEYLLGQDFNEPVYVQLSPKDIYEHREGKPFDLQDFFQHPENYDCDFRKYYSNTDLMINAIYWDPKAPIYFSKEAMKSSDFKIKTIADITCDIEGSIPATLKASTIANPVFGYDPVAEKEVEPFGENTIDIMSVDNLPNELPRDASVAFGEQLIEFVIPELLNPDSKMIERATIAQHGKLGLHFAYLQGYLEGH